MATTKDLTVVGREDGLPEALRVGTGSAALLVDKPGGMSSFGVVKKVRWALRIKKVGHAGTLDPMATGLLIILVGRDATRQQDRFMGLPKVYTGTIRLGETTASFDAETPVETRESAEHVTEADIEAVRERFVGELTQVPPVYSAIKKGGERLYKKARRGEEVEVPPRHVTVYDLQWTAIRREGETVDVDFRVESSKGFYVRSLANDVGEALGVGGHLTALRREAIGPFSVDEAFSLDAFEREEG
ncbi:MAG: tRNA pseudouridine(55) synthase TruB [Bacteroidota bacterium]